MIFMSCLGILMMICFCFACSTRWSVFLFFIIFALFHDFFIFMLNDKEEMYIFCGAKLGLFFSLIISLEWYNKTTRVKIQLKSCLNYIQGKYEVQYEQSEEFQQQLKIKVREILTEQEWRRRKMQMRVWAIILINFILYQIK